VLAVFLFIRWRDRIALLRRQRLEAMVEQRTAELSEQIRKEEHARAELAQAQQCLIELSRQSGMADAATGILHNVGNVLNSVNVSATLVVDAANEIRTDNLEAAIAMLREHADNLTEFVGGDPKGQRVLPYLAKLAGHFQQQRGNLISEAHSLHEMVGHMKEIVSTQQTYAKLSGLIERVSLSELVEDAIRIIQPGFDRHNIRLTRDFQTVPLADMDKHKVLQILLNLLRNAKQAISDSQSAQRQIRIATCQHGVDRVRIEIRDTGVGIPAENLTRIFAQGFTTKAGGHGFGLHASALAAQDMGGSLWAESNGPGEGATFTLELPA
jgi:C4-dicarboxylate-specific signal transduction histidine kinase